MNTLQMSVNNNLVSASPPREDHKPTIYKRILGHLIDKNLHPGKIFPLYALIKGNYHVLGAFTFNTGGTISFFPDVFGDLPFDHVTIAKDFEKNGGHLTTVKGSSNHSKVMEFDMEKLEDGDYHVMTFMMKDGSVLMDLPQKIELPNISVEEYEVEKFIGILQEATSNQTSIIDFPIDSKGIYCVQITLQTKRKPEREIKIYTKPLLDFLSIPSGIDEIIFARKIELYDGRFSPLSFYVSCFRVDGKTPDDSPMVFAINNGRVLKDLEIKIIENNKPKDH